MDKSITAEWARKTTKENLNEKVLKQIEECEAKIKSAVNRNSNSVEILFMMEELTIDEFKSRGFIVSDVIPSHDPRDLGGGHILISW